MRRGSERLLLRCYFIQVACYEAVNLCNTGLEFVGESGLPDDLQQQREAEIRFLSAFYYWHIVDAWGGVHRSTERIYSGQPVTAHNPEAAPNVLEYQTLKLIRLDC